MMIHHDEWRRTVLHPRQKMVSHHDKYRDNTGYLSHLQRLQHVPFER